MNEKQIQTMLQYFFEKQIPTHINLKNSTPGRTTFYNGIVMTVTADFILFNDEKLGEIPIFISDIFDVNVREPKVREAA